MANYALYMSVVCLISWNLIDHTLAEDDFEDSSTLTLEHTFDQGADAEFVRRGSITIRSFSNGIAQYYSDGMLPTEDLQKLKQVALDDGFYRIRVASRSSSGKTAYVSAFIKACLLYESSLTDFITVHVDLSGLLLGISMSTDVPYCQGADIDDGDLTTFDTHVHVTQTQSGPQPETQLYIQKMEAERAEKAKGAQADNRSFFGKYWMYIVPLVIFMMFASNADQGTGGR